MGAKTTSCTESQKKWTISEAHVHCFCFLLNLLFKSSKDMRKILNELIDSLAKFVLFD